MYSSLSELSSQMVDRLKETSGLDFEPTPGNVVKYYKRLENKIIEFNKWKPLIFYEAYPFDWLRLFTPIEQHAWSIIRSVGSVVFYPQYPVLNYRVDFANPVLKIILECDGKDFHDEAKDKIRDQALWAEGWRVFRVTGSELHKIVELEYFDIDDVQDYEDYRNRDCYSQESLHNFYLGTAEGVICAIRATYFLKNRNPFNLEGQLQLETLMSHRLINFPI